MKKSLGNQQIHSTSPTWPFFFVAQIDVYHHHKWRIGDVYFHIILYPWHKMRNKSVWLQVFQSTEFCIKVHTFLTRFINLGKRTTILSHHLYRLTIWIKNLSQVNSSTVLRHIFVHLATFSSTFAAFPQPSCCMYSLALKKTCRQSPKWVACLGFFEISLKHL